VFNKINIVLLAVLVVSALALITSQHEARRLYVEMERAASHSRQLETDWNHLRVEQSGLATAAIIDSKARRELQLESPNARQVWHLVVDPDSRQVQVAVPTPATGSRSPAPSRAVPKNPDPAAVPPQSPSPSIIRPLAAGETRWPAADREQSPSPGVTRTSVIPHEVYPRPVSAPMTNPVLGVGNGVPNPTGAP
jgi:cell division protein FtsL